MEPARESNLSHSHTVSGPRHSSISRLGGQREPHGHEHAHGHGLPYFETEAGSPSHAAASMPDPQEAANGSLSIKVDDGGSRGSPPPHATTTPCTTGSSTTPTSTDSTPGEHAMSHAVAAGSASKTSSGLPDSPAGPKGQAGSPSSPQRSSWSAPMMPSECPVPSPDSPFSQSPGGKYNPSAYPSAIKLLVSNNVAGSIIGRAGQTISELQAQSSTRIKLSQSGDYYPGTQDRVCLVQGQADDVKVAVQLLLERLYKLQEHQHSQQFAWQPPSQKTAMNTAFDFVVRLLVPSSSCGMLIGKAGSNIKQMEEASGVSSIRLSPKERPESPAGFQIVASPGTSERVVTLTAPDLESSLKCFYIILDGMTSHPDISRYSNMTTSYSRVAGRPVPQQPPEAPGSSVWEASPTPQTGLTRRVLSSPDLTAPQMLQDTIPAEPSGYITGRGDGLVPPSFSNPVFGASSFDSAPTNPFLRSQVPYLVPSSIETTQATAGVSTSSSAPDLLTLQLESMRITSTATTADYHFLTPFTAQVLVPDNIIGSILGRGGRTLHELQMHSGTRIRISQRGEYLPGTRNRIVTIRGPTAQSVSMAQYLMSQRMVLPPTAYQDNNMPPAQSPPSHHQPPQLPADHGSDTPA